MSAKKRSIKFKNIEFYHDQIVKKHLNYIRNVNRTFKIILEIFQMYKQKSVYAMQFLKSEFKNT